MRAGPVLLPHIAGEARSSMEVSVKIDGLDCKYLENPQGSVSILELFDPEGTRESIEIPREIDGLSVVEIKDGAIGARSAKTISIPSGVEIIGDYAFSKCPCVKEYVVENSYYFESDDGDLYTKGLKKLVKVACGKEIEEFFVPEEVTEIGVCAFSHSFVSHIFAGENVVKIGKGAFSYCENLSTIELCDFVEEIGEKAFVGSPKLTKIGVSPNNPCFLDIDGTLYTRDQRTLVCFPAGLKEITPSKLVEKIEDYAFFCCARLKKIALPRSVKHIGNNAFECCRNLTELELKGKLDYVGKNAFIDCKRLKSVSFLKGETVIAEQAFKNCEALEEINLPEGLCKISDSMLQDCRKLKKVAVPSTVRMIGGYALGGCRELEEIELPKDLSEIGEGAFGFSGIKKIEIPAEVKVIDKSTFSICHRLESIKLNEGLEKIGSFAFVGSGIKEIELPRSLKEIESFAFFDCAELKSAKVPEGVSVIGENAFEVCHKDLVVCCETTEKPQGWAQNWCGGHKAIFKE